MRPAGVKVMKGWIIAVAAALALAASPAVAQEADAGSQQQSNPQGMANAYNYTLPSTAGASCCGRYYDHKHADGNAVVVMTNFNQKLAAMQLAIIEAMRLSTGQLSGNLREQSGAGHTLADQQDDRATVKAVEEARLQAIRDAESGAGSCVVISGGRGGGSAEGRNTYIAQMNESIGAFERGEEGPSVDGQSAAALARLEMHCQMFASKADIESGICKAEGDIPAGDTTASESIFHRQDNLFSTLSEDRSKAAMAFIQNVTVPNTYTPIDKTMANTIEGREEAARRNASQARSSLAQHVLAVAAADRTGSSDSKMVGWAKGQAGKMSGYESASFTNGVSHRDWLEINSRMYLLDGTMLLDADKTPASAIKAIKNMDAIALYQNWEIIQHLERISVTLAAQLAILTEGTRTDILK